MSNRANTYLQLSMKINDELLNRDLKTISTVTLLNMSITNDTRLKELLNKNFRLVKIQCAMLL
ncbi:MAG: hypothetical protein IPF58_17070 [Saprospirales bacterium]|nr:hypothetical protein [Saprospirales bacterium]